ncbi:MAG: hypothetical protein ABIG44_03350 [Planctomycetota bacterium]
MRCLRTNYPAALLKRTVLSLVVMLALAPAALTQDFAIDWYTIDSGGAMWTTGGDFELSGTIGQPDAGVVMTGDDFALTGGFWAGVPAFGLGDMNCDGIVNAYDIDGFILAVSSYPDFDAYYERYPDCDPWLADVNRDGVVNSYDIDGFIALVAGGGGG